MDLDAEAPEGVGEDVTDGVIEVVVTVIFPGIDIFYQPFAGITERLQHPVFRFQLGAPNFGIVRAREDHFHFVNLLEFEVV